MELRSEWLIHKSSNGRGFDEFCNFLSECANVPSVSTSYSSTNCAPLEKKTRNSSDSIDCSATVANFWSSELVSELLGTAASPPATLMREENSRLLPERVLHRILLLVHEEFSVRSEFFDETHKLRSLLLQLSMAIELPLYSDYFGSLLKSAVCRTVPNLPAILSFCLDQSQLDMPVKIPIDITQDSRIFLVLCLYSAAFLGLTVMETKEVFTADVAKFVGDGESEKISTRGNFEHTENVEKLVGLLAFCPIATWLDIPNIIRLPLLQILMKNQLAITRSLTSLGPGAENVEAILGKNELCKKKSIIEGGVLKSSL